MTLPRTIKRRDKRKRAKARPKSTGLHFIVSDWLIQRELEAVADTLRCVNLINRQYSDKF